MHVCDIIDLKSLAGCTEFELLNITRILNGDNNKR